MQDSDRTAQRRFVAVVNRQLIRRLFASECLAIVEVVAEITAEVPPPEGGWPPVDDFANELGWTGAIERAGSKVVVEHDGREREVPVFRLGNVEAAKRYFMTSAREAVA